MRKMSVVTNESDRDYREEFEGRVVVVPAKASIEMPRGEAVKFMGKYGGWDEKRGEMREKPLSVKHAPIEPDEVFFDHMTGRQFKSREEYETHIGMREQGMRERDEKLSNAIELLARSVSGGKLPETIVKKEREYVCVFCDLSFENPGGKMKLLNHMKKCQNEPAKSGK
jgi:hypothetical protein